MARSFKLNSADGQSLDGISVRSAEGASHAFNNAVSPAIQPKVAPAPQPEQNFNLENTM